MTRINGKYEMKSWNETPVREFPSPQKCTRVDVEGIFTGEIEGEGQTSYLLAYISEKRGTYTGYTHFIGKYLGEDGNFVMAEEGVFDEAGAKSKWTIIKESGEGSLKECAGTGGFFVADGMIVDFELEVTFPS